MHIADVILHFPLQLAYMQCKKTIQLTCFKPGPTNRAKQKKEV